MAALARTQSRRASVWLRANARDWALSWLWAWLRAVRLVGRGQGTQTRQQADHTNQQDLTSRVLRMAMVLSYVRLLRRLWRRYYIWMQLAAHGFARTRGPGATMAPHPREISGRPWCR